jgi:hypothetical protein
MWPAVARCATDVKHKEGGQQAHDEQLQQRSGRRARKKVARSTIEPTRAHEPAQTPATGYIRDLPPPPTVEIFGKQAHTS